MSRRSWATRHRAWRTSSRCCRRSRCRRLPRSAGWSRRAWPSCSRSLVVVGLRRRKRRPIEPRRQTPEEIAQAALARLLAENLPGRGLVKEFYLRLTGIVRQYVEDTTGIRAPEQTTEEFLRDMRSRAVFPPERSARLAEFLEAADLVKYAGQQPQEDQIDQAIARAHEFVNLQAGAGCRTGRRRRGLRHGSRGARLFP